MSKPTKEAILESISTLIDSATTDDTSEKAGYKLPKITYVVVNKTTKTICFNEGKPGIFLQFAAADRLRRKLQYKQTSNLYEVHCLNKLLK